MIEQADEVLFLMSEAVGTQWVLRLRPDARSLHEHYEPGRSRREIYDAIVADLVAPVRAGAATCGVFYGHPGVFVDPSHRAVALVRSEGFPARMLPAVSAEDCLFADVGVDPGASGCQSYEASNFLLYRRRIDPNAALILWQISVIGETVAAVTPVRERLPLLAERLLEFYPPDHLVTLYEASPYVVADPIVAHLPLRELPGAEVTAMATLYVPPLAMPELDAVMAERLGLSQT